jgi:hypothetical protein
MTKNIGRIAIGSCMALAGIGCGQSRASGQPERPSKTTAPLGSVSTAGGAGERASAKITRVVFVGKEHPCECTKKRLDTGWAALEEALGTPPKVPVEQLKVDTEPEKVEPYQKQKPTMTLPALYFVDGKDSVVELLQGEVTREQIAAALAR